jgi:hypothetical protein
MTKISFMQTCLILQRFDMFETAKFKDGDLVRSFLFQPLSKKVYLGSLSFPSSQQPQPAKAFQHKASLHH